MAVAAQRVLNGLNVGPLLDQIAKTGNPLWNADPCWIPPNSPYAPDNIVLRYNGRNVHWSHWNKPAFDILDAAQQLVFTLMYAVRGEVLGKVGITRMKGGDKLAPHVDAAAPVMFERYQIPLVTPPGAVFLIDGHALDMEPGTAWWFDKTHTHSVENNSKFDRLAMVVEIHSS